MINFLKSEIAKRSSHSFDIIIKSKLSNSTISILITDIVTGKSYVIEDSSPDYIRYQLDKYLGRSHEDSIDTTIVESKLVCSKCNYIFKEGELSVKPENIRMDKFAINRTSISPTRCPKCNKFIESIQVKSPSSLVEIN